MKKLLIPTLAITFTLLFACNNTSNTESIETEPTEETVSDVIENDTTIQNELDNANKDLEEMMRLDANDTIETK